MLKRRQLVIGVIFIIAIYLMTLIVTTNLHSSISEGQDVKSHSQRSHIAQTNNSTIHGTVSVISKERLKVKNVLSYQFPPIFVSQKSSCVQRRAGKVVLSDHDLPLTAMASPWRTGNTWIRHLLQMATGLGTSSLYCDMELSRKGFPFECSHTQFRRSLIVKSHEPNIVRNKAINITSPSFERAILIIRDPYNYIVANIYSGHLDTAKEEDYLREDSKWRKSHPLLLEWWNVLNEYWLKEFKGPVYPLLYSKFLTDTETELKNVLDFLRVQYTDADIKCAIGNKEGSFHRKRIVWKQIRDITELFNSTVKSKIDESIKSLSNHLRLRYNVSWMNEVHETQK